MNVRRLPGTALTQLNDDKWALADYAQAGTKRQILTTSWLDAMRHRETVRKLARPREYYIEYFRQFYADA